MVVGGGGGGGVKFFVLLIYTSRYGYIRSKCCFWQAAVPIHSCKIEEIDSTTDIRAKRTESRQEGWEGEDDAGEKRGARER